MTTNTARGPTEFDSGQMKNRLTVVRNSPMKSVFKCPRRSAAKPETKRPIAEEMLKPATRPAPTLEERPREVQ